MKVAAGRRGQRSIRVARARICRHGTAFATNIEIVGLPVPSNSGIVAFGPPSCPSAMRMNELEFAANAI